MTIFEDMNQRVKKLTIFDIKLVQACAMLVILIIVKLIPQIMMLSIWWFVALLVLCAIRPLYVFYFKK
ncbi:hypothetical protein AMJ87_02500 [candidate division WOR_3 bacterium SM23_60]|jgi:hypothetical protein|uniref:Uncharacterized protein n=1 Tax=candidate division WOR_3 bacterium SM23_60 TaxID=1703780 RepID=A0A0S8GJP8_UNCW3|nr:MAG: hypothetical protein AMJ87_02500 [candidate division WOR_3 bacterium SM23_60]